MDLYRPSLPDAGLPFSGIYIEVIHGRRERENRVAFNLRSGLRILKNRALAYRIFFKIFVWFWVTGLGIFLLTGYYNMQSAAKDAAAATRMYATVAPNLAAQAVSLYESGDRDGFAHFMLDSIDDRYRKFYLLDRAYKDVLGRQVEDDGLHTAKEAQRGEAHVSDGHIAYKTISPSGRRYVLLIYSRSDLGNLKDFLFRHDFTSTVAMYLLAILFSMWLAHHIAAPIRSMQTTARRVATGDLSARVPANVSKRHDELAALAVDFDSMVDRLEALIRSQKDLLSSVSHEVRSPLARINLSLAILKSEWTGEPSDTLCRLENDVERIDTLMGHLLTLSRLEAGLSSAEREDVNLSQILQEVAADSDFEAQSQGKSVCLIAPDNIHVAKADSHALRSAFENILRNAVRFTRPGTNVEVTAKQEQRAATPIVVVSVRDCGPGVPEESLQTIFQPFVQLASHPSAGDCHNGLGLAIASEAIRMHAGCITAANLAHGGLEVTVELPAVQSRSIQAD